jgi:hypothetical protein
MFNGELSLCEMQFGGIFMKMIQRVGIMWAHLPILAFSLENWNPNYEAHSLKI